jgi:hypothetical protein
MCARSAHVLDGNINVFSTDVDAAPRTLARIHSYGKVIVHQNIALYYSYQLNRDTQ